MNNDKFHLNLPSKSDYIRIVRLTTSGICSNMNFNVDEIDDIKVCVGEACNNILGQKDNQCEQHKFFRWRTCVDFFQLYIKAVYL